MPAGTYLPDWMGAAQHAGTLAADGVLLHLDDAHTKANHNRYSEAYWHSDSQAHSQPDAKSNAHGNTQTNGNRDCETHSNANPDRDWLLCWQHRVIRIEGQRALCDRRYARDQYPSAGRNKHGTGMGRI